MSAVSDTSPTLATTDLAAKDRNPPSAVPPPGGPLLDAIEQHAAAGCPAWRVAGRQVWVPRLLTAQVSSDRISPYLLPAVEDAMITGAVELAWRSAEARQQAAALLAAALRDLNGQSPASIMRMLADADVEYSDVRSVRRLAQQGRELWARLHGWPWYVLPRYEEQWWTRADVAAEWDRWRDPQRWKHAWRGPRPL
jgi:hypothetical protein